MKKRYTKKQIQEAISYWKKQLAKGNYRKLNESASSVALTGKEQYLGPSMGKYRMTLKKNGRVQDTYEWECFLFNQANSDGCGEAINRFAKNDLEFADLLDSYEDDIMDVGIVEDSWEDPDGVYELSISPSTVQWEDFPAGWRAPMTSVVLEPDQLELLGKDSSSAGNLNESAVAGNGPRSFTVTLLRDQTNGLDVMASDENEAESIAREIVDSGNLYDYIDENAWYSNPVEIGNVEEA